MPVLVVKSLPSSTSALAGSHAAQHRVNCLASAGAGPDRHEATTTAVAPNARIVRIIKTSLLSQAICPPACHSHFVVDADQSGLREKPRKTLFSIFVKQKSFTKHHDCQL